MCQRLEVPRKPAACHLRFFTLGVACFPTKASQTKAPTCWWALHSSQCFCLVIFVYSFFCPEYFTQLPPPFFSRSTTVELQPRCNSQKKALLHFPGSAPFGAVLPRHLGDETAAHFQRQQHRSPREGQGPFLLLQSATVSISLANNKCGTNCSKTWTSTTITGRRDELPTNKTNDKNDTLNKEVSCQKSEEEK